MEMERKLDYNKIMMNTLSALGAFKNEIDLTTLIHIPHSSEYIPSFEGMNIEKAKEEVQLLTDWATEEIFNINNCTQIVVPFSRVFCDVERLPDEQEAMFKKGRGFYYTHCDNGERLREDNLELKQKIFEEYYQPHQEYLLKICQAKIDQFGFCNLIDAHSFSEQPLKTEDNQDILRPDICLGTDDFHTPISWINKLKSHFENNGFTVEINHPYSGTIVPLSMYKKEKRLNSIMIEVNKRCYMHKGKVIPEKIERLNEIMNAIHNN
jgi:N-formylglutamate amidohydrolase